MQIVNKETGETSIATQAGGALLIKRGTHELPSKQKVKAAAKKTALAEHEETEE